MKRRGANLSWSALVALFVNALIGCGSPAAALEHQTRSDFEWFSTLGFPEVKGCPLVRVATGEWSRSGDEPPRNRYFRAFLLATNGGSFRVLTSDLFDRTLTNTPASTPEHERIGFEFLSLAKEAATLIGELQRPPAKEGFPRRFGESLAEPAEVFALAWGCWCNGLDRQAQDLYSLAQKIPSRRGGQEKVSTFRETVEKDLGHALMWRAIVSFGEPSISRAQLLSQLEDVVRHYPHCEHVERARKTAALLWQMIAEDEAHARNGPKDLSQLPIAARVQELIFRLRDQNGQQWGQPGWCDIFMDWRGTTNTPAHQLVALGYAAVPQLIAALDSPILTRSVGYHRNFYFSHTVLTVGDCAQAILHRITGRSFYSPKTTSSYMSRDQQASATRKAAEAWWAEFQKKGEKEILMEGVAAAEDDAPAQAELLCQKYPEVATATLIRGAQATTNAWIRSRLVEQVAKLGKPPGLEFLKEELIHGPAIQTRVAAASGLRRNGDSSALPAMILEWEKRPEKKSEDEWGWEQVIDFLASCDAVEAVSALAKNLRQRPVGVKLKVVEALGETNRFLQTQETQAPSLRTIAAVEQCLVSALEDTEERVGMSGTRNNKSFSDPRICDMAGYFLAERWPDRYRFDLSGSLKNRNRQRIECLNTWRRAHNLATIPLPSNPTARVSREEAAKVTAIEWATDSLKPQKALAAQVASFQGTRLNGRDWVRLLAHFAGEPEPGAAGVEFRAYKDEDLTGVRVVIKLIAGDPPAKSQGWSVNQRVQLGRKSLHGSSGSGTVDYYADAHHWEDFEKAMQQAIAGPPETPFEISVRLVGQKH